MRSQFDATLRHDLGPCRWFEDGRWYGLSPPPSHSVAVENDNHPAIRIWDLRVSTASPISELTGHHKGVLGLSWCPFDDSFLLSCGKDNRVLLWDVKSCSLIEEVEGSAEEQAAPQDATMFFTSMSAASATRKTQIDWCPVYPGLACASSTDRTLTIYNLQAPGAKTLRRAPKWIERPCGVSFGFGGKLVMFNGTSKHVGIAQLTPDQHLIEESKDFDEAMSTGDMKSLCMKRCDTEQNPAYRDMWNFMKCMFNADARDSLVQYLGYNQAVESEEEFKPLEVHEEVEEEEPAPEEETKAPEQFDGIGFSPSIDSLANAMFSQPPPAISAEELFSKPLDNLPLSTPPAMTLPTPSSPIGSIMSGVSNVPIAPSTPKESVLSESSSAKEVLDPTWVADVRMAIICGNFERAVDLCFDNHRYGDALLISSWGEPELLNQTQLRYMNEVFPSELRCFNSIVRGDLSTYVQNSRLEDWRDTLVLILTYGKTEEFIQLCQQLSTKLEENYFVNEALLCSICAMDLPSVIRLGLKFNINKDIDELVPVLEVICILNHMQEESGESLPELPSNLVHNVITLCTSLVDQGLVSMATRFIRAIGKSDEGELLLYRIYQCYPEALNGYVPRPPLETPRAPEVRPVATVPQASRFPAVCFFAFSLIVLGGSHEQISPFDGVYCSYACSHAQCSHDAQCSYSQCSYAFCSYACCSYAYCSCDAFCSCHAHYSKGNCSYSHSFYGSSYSSQEALHSYSNSSAHPARSTAYSAHTSNSVYPYAYLHSFRSCCSRSTCCSSGSCS